MRSPFLDFLLQVKPVPSRPLKGLVVEQRAIIQAGTCRKHREDYLRTVRVGWKFRLENWVFSIARKRLTRTLSSLLSIECQVGKLGVRLETMQAQYLLEHPVV